MNSLDLHRSLSAIKLIVIQNPYHCWDLPGVKELFLKTMTLKIEGYRDKYPTGVIPVDTTDWIATQFIACLPNEKDGSLMPITGLRCITLADCKTHFMTYPLLSLARSRPEPIYADAVQSAIDRCQAKNSHLSYTGAFTIAPHLRSNKLMVQVLLNLILSLHLFFHRDLGLGAEMLIAPVMRFRMDQHFTQYGFDLMKDSNGETLPPFCSPFLGGEQVQFMGIQEISAVAMALTRPFQEIWQQRQIIEPLKPSQLIAA